MSKHKKHSPNSGSFLKKVFSKKQTMEAYTDLEWEAKQGLERLGEDGATEALARIHKRIESQKRKPSKKPVTIPLWRYAAAAACAGLLIVIGNQIINSTDNAGPISYDAQETPVQNIPQNEGSAPSTEAIKENFADESIPDEGSSVNDSPKDEVLHRPNSETEIQRNAIPPPPPPAESALVLDILDDKVSQEQEEMEDVIVEEDLSEEMVVFDIPNDLEDQSTGQGSAGIEQEENTTVAFRPDEMAPNEVMSDEVLPELTYRSSEKVSLSQDNMTASDAPEPVYDWSSAFAEEQFEEITNRFEESNWAEQPTNEEAMYYTARAYYALGNLNQALVIIKEVIDLNGEKAGEAQHLLEQWEE